ncbi:Sister chromatid cohesion protein PDS5 -like protein B [Halotydeus destructor]|nr:Sister chromatid cohesion protein PDS5 -like protein B [Halotydeus destructor]
MHFLVNHPELRIDITEQLKQRQHDPDENVRYEVVMAIISAAKKSIDNINEDLLSFVKERTLDKKFKIRKEALFGMAQLYKQYNVATLNDDSSDVSASNNSLKMLLWIKNKCLHNYYQSLLDDRLLVERILHICLIPYSQPLAQRMKTLYTLYCTIDSHAARAFNELMRQQLSVRKQVKEVLDILKEDKTEERDLMLKQRILMCAKNLQEPVKAEEYLTKLCRNLEINPALRQHMEIIVTATSYAQVNEDGTPVAPPSCSTIEASVKEVLKSLGFPVQTNSFYVIIKQLMERIAPVMIDHDGLLILFRNVADALIGDGELDAQYGLENSAKRGLQLILALSSVFPAIFHGREIFTSFLLPFLWQQTDNPHIAEIVLQILTNVGASAGSYQTTTNSDGTVVSVPWWAADEDTIPRMIDRFILKPASTKQAKYAAQCLNAIIQDDSEKMKVFAQILDQIKNTGISLDSPYFRNHLVTVGVVATCGGHLYFPKLLRSIIQRHVVQNLLLKDQRLPEEVASQEESEIARDATDPGLVYELCSEEVKCKVEGIKLMARWCYGLKLNSLVCTPEHQSEAISAYQKAASNTLQLLKTLVQNGGDLNDQGIGGTTVEKAHLRMAAASAMLKIVNNDSLTAVNGDPTSSQVTSPTSPIISAQQWHTLATVLLDREDFVREKFGLKLHKALLSLSLGLEFLAILCLGGTFELNTPFRNKIRNYLMLNLAKRRDLVKSKNVLNLKAMMPDCVMPFVIHLLSHMPFYTQYDDVSQLESVKECLWFIMEPLVLKNEHYSFSFYKRTFENIKTCVDKVSASSAEGEANITMTTMTNYKIYCACDLALGLVMSKTQNFLLKDFPVQPSLPGKYYMVSPSASDNNLKNYLPTELQFAPPKRCGLEVEMLGKITKSFNSNQQPTPLPVRKQVTRTSNQPTQILIVSSDNLIVEDSLMADQDQPKVEQPQAPRVRKQDLGSIMSDDSEREIENKQPKVKAVEATVPLGQTAATRSTRAAARAANEETAEEENGTIQEDTAEKSQAAEGDPEEIEDEEYDESQDAAEDELDEEADEDVEEAGDALPRKRGRPRTWDQ